MVIMGCSRPRGFPWSESRGTFPINAGTIHSLEAVSTKNAAIWPPDPKNDTPKGLNPGGSDADNLFERVCTPGMRLSAGFQNPMKIEGES
jgi:hypothetical protein